jgi:hypothetical protein
MGIEKFRSPEGDTYEGDWKDGKYYGNGTFLWKDGKKYVGEFKNGLRHGYGKLHDPQGVNFINVYARIFRTKF